MQGYKYEGFFRTPGSLRNSSISENTNWLTANAPCDLLLGTMWRIPTYTEWNNVNTAGGMTSWTSIWNSALKLYTAGNLELSDEILAGRGT